MKTYASQIIYSIKCNGQFTGQYDSQWRLVFAETEEAAINETRNVGANEAAMFVDRHGRNISWEFLAIKDVKEIEIGHGTLLCSSVIDVEPIAAPVWIEETV